MKKLLLLLLCVPLIGFGQTDTTEYWDKDSVMMIKCIGDCENGFGERSAEVPNSCITSQYTGFFKNGKFDGEGSYYIATASGGCKYVGEWKNGKRYGRGIETEEGDNEWQYVGEFKDNLRHGEGSYTWYTGDKYVGEWKGDKQDGQGTMTYADGTVEEGLWENGEFIGKE